MIFPFKYFFFISLVQEGVFEINRRLRGEELQGLSIEELQHLESSLEAGLNRVIEKKVLLEFLNCAYS